MNRQEVIRINTKFVEENFDEIDRVVNNASWKFCKSISTMTKDDFYQEGWVRVYDWLTSTKNLLAFR